MTIHPHQALNGHTVSPPAHDVRRGSRRAALSATFSAMMKDIQAAGEALKSAEQRAQEFQTALSRLDEEDPEEEEEEKAGSRSQACLIDQDAGPSADPAPEEKGSSEKGPFQSEEKGSSEKGPFQSEEKGSSEKGSSEKGPFQSEENWKPPFQPSGQRKSFAHHLIGERSGFIPGWFGTGALKAIRDIVANSSKADSRLMLEQIASSVESGDIQWAGQTFASHSVQLRWLFPYLPPKFADNNNPTSLARGLIPNMDLFRQLNDLCRERTRKDHETRLKNGYPAFHRSKKDDEELDRFAQQWWREQRMAQASAAKSPPEKAAAPPAPPSSTLDEARAIALDPSRWTMDTMPIIYHGVMLWPPEPDKPNPISRTDAEIAYWLSTEYLVEVRRLRGKNPRLDAMDLRLKFKYLKKIPECAGLLRAMHIIANIVNNDIGTDAENRIPLFELNLA